MPPLVTFFNFFTNLTIQTLSKMPPVVIISGKIPKIISMLINDKEFLTVRDMAERLGKSAAAVKTLLFRYGFEPVSKNALYPIEAYETIKDAPGKGRPPKAKAKKNKNPPKEA
jgi:hypothetical protein